MIELREDEIVSVNGGHPLLLAAVILGRAGAVGGLIGLGYYFSQR